MTICVDDWNGSICPSGGESDKDYCILCGRQLKRQMCLFIKSQLHKVILSDEWRSTGTENKFTVFIRPKRTYIQ